MNIDKSSNVCQDCSLREHDMVLYDVLGNIEKQDTDFLFIGINPGKEEVVHQRPFTGPSGRFLRQMIDEVGLLEYKIVFTNAILCSTSSEREIGNIEQCIKNCKENSGKIIDYFKPKIYVPVGRNSSEYLFGIKGQISENSGLLFKENVVPLIHPASVLRARNEKNVNRFKNSLNNLKNYIE